MTGEDRLLSSGSPANRLGRLVAAGHRRQLAPYVVRPSRSMPDWVLCVVGEGTGSFEDSSGEPTEVVAPAAILVPPATAHWYGAPPGQVWTETWAVFGGPVFDPLARPGVAAVHPLASPAAPERLRELLEPAVRGTAAAELQLVALLDWLVTELPVATPGRSEPVARAADLLADRLEEPLEMTEVADHVGLGYDTFRRRFRAEVGTSPLAYRSARRLEAAANLLRATDMTIRSVARATGFTDEFHLSRRFRQEFGLPPSHYRRRG